MLAWYRTVTSRGYRAPVRPFRFAFQAASTYPAEVVRLAQSAEERGFHVVQIGDHIGAEPGLLTSLTAMALSTSRIRICPLVVNNDLRHPVLLAQESWRLSTSLAGDGWRSDSVPGTPFRSTGCRTSLRLARGAQGEVSRIRRDCEEVP